MNLNDRPKCQAVSEMSETGLKVVVLNRTGDQETFTFAFPYKRQEGLGGSNDPELVDLCNVLELLHRRHLNVTQKVDGSIVH